MKISTIYQLYKLSCTMFIYKCLNSNKYLNFKNRMSRNSQNHNYNTRNNSQFRLPASRLKCIQQSFFYEGTDLWNRLNTNLTIYKPNIQFKSNLSSFKKRIKAKLMTDTL